MAAPHQQPTIGVGIDFGTTYTGAAMYRIAGGLADLRDIPIENSQDNPKFPTVVYHFNAPHRPPLVGRAALSQARLDENDKVGKLYSLFKLQLGTDWHEYRGGRRITTESLACEVLTKVRHAVEAELREYPGSTIRYAFSHPGTWGEKAIAALGRAIIDAGFPPGFQVIDEPVATALGAARELPESGLLARGNHILICDLGGGTFDLAVVTLQPDGAIRVKGGAGGNGHLGMSNLDKILAMLWLKKAIDLPPQAEQMLKDHIVNGVEVDLAWDAIPQVYTSHTHRSDLLRQAEVKKIEICRYWDTLPATLSESLPTGHVVLFNGQDIQPSIDRMNQEVQASVDTYIRGLSAHHITYNTITRVVFSGGGSGLPGIAAGVEQLFARHRTTAQPLLVRLIHHDGPLMVQRGTARFAFDHDIVMERRFNASYGVRTSDEEKPKGGTEGWPKRQVKRNGEWVTCYDKYQLIFKRHDPIPSSPKIVEFPPLGDGPGTMVLEVLAGESENPDKNDRITLVKIALSPDARADTEKKIKLTFALSSSGLMQVQAFNPDTNEESDMQAFNPSDEPRL